MFQQMQLFWRIALLAILVPVVTAIVAPMKAQGQSQKLNGTFDTYVVYTPNAWDLLSDYLRHTHSNYPVIVYLHGANHTGEAAYDAMLRDIAAQSGSYIVFPKYNASDGNTAEYYERAKLFTTEVLRDLPGFLQRQGPLFGPVDVTNVGFVGHSVGGMFALRMASDLDHLNAQSIVLHDPSGWPDGLPSGFLGLPDIFFLSQDNLANIPSQTMRGTPTKIVSIISWDAISHEFSGVNILQLGGGIFSGIWSRLQSNSPSGVQKPVFISGNHRSPASDYSNSGGVYRFMTVNAIRHAFRGESFNSSPPNVFRWGFSGIVPR